MSLRDAVENAINGKPGEFGVYARNLNTDETISVHADRVLPAESAAKSFILVHYSQLVASGAVDPMARLALDDEHRYIGTGVLRFLASGLAPTLDDLAWLMIIVSDNTDCIAVGVDRHTRGGQRRDARPRVPDRATQQHHLRASVGWRAFLAVFSSRPR